MPIALSQTQQYDQESSRISRLASIGQISAGIAHEVKNPLTSVKGFLQLIREEYEHNYLDIAMDELESALGTLNNLLQVSRPELESEEYEYINLCSELESIISLFQDQIYRVKIVKHFQNMNKVIYGKKNSIKKAFFNILKNGFEAIPNEGKIEISSFQDSKGINVKISDTGVGIPQDKIDMLGTPFFSTKDTGTGMGLTQVFTTFNQHGAKVNISSKIGEGTTFLITFPVAEKREFEVVTLTNVEYVQGQAFKDFIFHNQSTFDKHLHNKTEEIFLELEDSPYNEQQLFELAYRIIDCIHNNAEHEIIQLAKDYGETWAKHSIPTVLSLEWLQGFRDVYWDFLFNYCKNQDLQTSDFFTIEKRKNYYLDTFIKHQIISYNNFKEQQLESQREVIEELTVPIISISNDTAILPIVGTVDTYRAKKLQEKSLKEVEKLRLKKIIIDLSGVAYMDTAVAGHLFNIIEGYKLLGCKAILTGIRSEIANTMVEMGIPIGDKVETLGNLQQALEEYQVKLS